MACKAGTLNGAVLAVGRKKGLKLVLLHIFKYKQSEKHQADTIRRLDALSLHADLISESGSQRLPAMLRPLLKHERTALSLRLRWLYGLNIDLISIGFMLLTTFLDQPLLRGRLSCVAGSCHGNRDPQLRGNQSGFRATF